MPRDGNPRQAGIGHYDDNMVEDEHGVMAPVASSRMSIKRQNTRTHGRRQAEVDDSLRQNFTATRAALGEGAQRTVGNSDVEGDILLDEILLGNGGGF